MHQQIRQPLFGLALIFASSLPTFADVASWRNGGNGKYPESKPSVRWNDSILWETQLSDWSNASPILIGNKLFVCQEPSTLLCFDSRNGDLLWERSHELLDLLALTDADRARIEDLRDQDAKLEKERNRLENNLRRAYRRARNEPDNEALKESIEKSRAEMDRLDVKRKELANDPELEETTLVRTHRINGYTSFTPVSDGHLIYAAFGNGIVAAYDFEGNKAWIKGMEKPGAVDGGYEIGGSTSPLVVDGKLIVRFDDYAALDLKTGDEIWRTPSEMVFGTPIAFEVEDETFLFTPRGELIRASDGKVLQSGLVELHPKDSYSAFTSPVIYKRVIYSIRGCNYNGSDGHAQAYRIPKDLNALYEKGLEPIWHTKVWEKNYFASPVIHDGLIYAICSDFTLTALEAETGKIVYEHKIEGLKGNPYSSLTLAGDTIFLASDEGTLVALQPGREYKELARSQFDAFRSTPIFDGDTGYLRTYSSLYAVGSK